MLTSAQRTTLATDINAQSSLSAARIAKDATLIIAFYNALSSPTVAVWRSDVKSSEMVAACVPAEVVVLTAIKQFWLTFAMQPNTIDASSANVRAGFSAVFAAGTTLTALTAMAQRTATRLEVLLGSGGPPIVSQVFGYSLTHLDVQLAMGWAA